LKVHIKFFTHLREITNKKDETLNIPNTQTTIANILKLLSEEYGENFDSYVYEGKTGKAKGFLQFLVNGNSTSTLEGLETEVKDGDVLAILPPVGGG
jgi:sulfur-carrier protein